MLFLIISVFLYNVHGLSKTNNFNEKNYFLATCTDIKINIKSPVNSSGTFDLTFEASGGTAPYHFIFFESSGKLVGDSFNKTLYNSIPGGDYVLTVIDNKNCRVDKSIQLK